MQETKEMWVWSLGQEDPLKEGMATHATILAWEILRTEEPGGSIEIVLYNKQSHHNEKPEPCNEE